MYHVWMFKTMFEALLIFLFVLKKRWMIYVIIFFYLLLVSLTRFFYLTGSVYECHWCTCWFVYETNSIAHKLCPLNLYRCLLRSTFWNWSKYRWISAWLQLQGSISSHLITFFSMNPKRHTCWHVDILCSCHFILCIN